MGHARCEPDDRCAGVAVSRRRRPNRMILRSATGGPDRVPAGED